MQAGLDLVISPIHAKRDIELPRPVRALKEQSRLIPVQIRLPGGRVSRRQGGARRRKRPSPAGATRPVLRVDRVLIEYDPLVLLSRHSAASLDLPNILGRVWPVDFAHARLRYAECPILSSRT